MDLTSIMQKARELEGKPETADDPAPPAADEPVGR